MNLTPAQYQTALMRLSLFHILIIASSNYLCSCRSPSLASTPPGCLQLPFIFLATDLTVRIFGAGLARKIIQTVMLPALTVSYVLSVLFFEGVSRVGNLAEFNLFVARIALASFMAYLVGQFMDVVVFNRLRLLKAWWWVAPAASTLFGNLVDTIAFFSIAFWRSTDPFMAEHWVEIATVDYVFKLLISLGLFVPLYGVLLRYLSRKLVGEAGLAGLAATRQSLMR